MTRDSILEYAEAVRGRYLRPKKGLKTKILDEFVAATGLLQKANIRLLNGAVGLLAQRGREDARLFTVLKQWGRSRLPASPLTA